MKRRYQRNYASGRPQMYEQKSRKEKAVRMVKTLEDFMGGEILKKQVVLDVGASTGIIDNVLADHFNKVVGIDIDEKAIKHAEKNFRKKNLEFKVDDAMALSFSKDSFDVVICAHVYEHVPDSQKLFNEIYRVLKPGGACYLAAINKLWPWEPHYDLPFLSWLPKIMANFYVRIRGKSKEYYESPKTYWGLKNLLKNFKVIDYTPNILSNPKKYGYNNVSLGKLSDIAKYFTPTMFWILEKKI